MFVIVGNSTPLKNKYKCSLMLGCKASVRAFPECSVDFSLANLKIELTAVAQGFKNKMKIPTTLTIWIPDIQIQDTKGVCY